MHRGNRSWSRTMPPKAGRCRCKCPAARQTGCITCLSNLSTEHARPCGLCWSDLQHGACKKDGACPLYDLDIWTCGNTFESSSNQLPRFMTARHLLSIAGRRAVPDCVKPAGAGGFTQLFLGCALPVAAIQPI